MSILHRLTTAQQSLRDVGEHELADLTGRLADDIREGRRQYWTLERLIDDLEVVVSKVTHEHTLLTRAGIAHTGAAEILRRVG